MADQDRSLAAVRMLVVSGRGEDSQWFDYRPGFFADIVRVEWDLDTMDAVITSNVADYLIRHGYAVSLDHPVADQRVEPSPVDTSGAGAPPPQPPAPEPPVEEPPAPPPPPAAAAETPAPEPRQQSDSSKRKQKEKSK